MKASDSTHKSPRLSVSESKACWPGRPAGAWVIAANGRNDSYNAQHLGYYVDGGMLNNAPFNVFDYARAVPHQRQLVREVSPIAWSPARAKADGWSLARLAAESVPKEQYKTLAFIFNEPKALDLAVQAAHSSWPSISTYLSVLLETLLYSANAGQYEIDRRSAEIVELDANNIAIADFSNITLDSIRFSSLKRIGIDPSRIKMMAIMNAYNTTWDRIGRK